VVVVIFHVFTVLEWNGLKMEWNGLLLLRWIYERRKHLATIKKTKEKQEYQELVIHYIYLLIKIRL